MEDLKIILSITTSIMVILSTILTLLVKAIKNNKTKKTLQGVLSCTNQLIPLIQEAERFINYTGEEKKEYVITRINKYMKENNIKMCDDELSNKIDELVLLTKNVNYKKNTNKELKKISEVNYYG